ncbi:MAG: CoA transferase [Rhodospirillales bacterium]|nr:CoA transferase [Rhodospirillales bacterium]
MRPLEAIKVLDLTRVVAGPYCTMILGDMGADVIKVEHPKDGDDSRGFAPPYQGDQAAYYLSVNRNKRSLTLDLKSPKGQDILWQLIEGSDVLVENFRPGVMARLGFGYDDVARRNKGIVYCSISGFGQTGPQRDRPGYDVIVQAESGIMDLTGPADGAPHKVGTSIADLVTGQTAVNGILAALLVKNTTGQGQFIDISMLEATSALLTFNASIYFATGEAPKRRGNGHATIVPYEAFETSDKAWINLGVANDSLWKRFCTLVGRDDLQNDPRFALAPDRVANRDVLVPIVAALMRSRPRDTWIRELEAAGIPAAAIRTVAEVCESDVLRARDMITEMPHATAGPVKGIKSPLHMSGSPLDRYVAPPILGEHSGEILRERCGLGDEEIAQLRKESVI